MQKALLSSERVDWNTPQNIVDLLEQMGGVAFDPCSNPQSIVSCQKSCMLERGEDGLIDSWITGGLIYCNPPYGKEISVWAEKIASEALRAGTEIICLVPSRTDTAWMQQLFRAGNPLVLFWKGRLRFVGASHSAPFPSALFYWGQRKNVFQKVFGPHGYLFRTFECQSDT